jgi:monothiol glutaredoxin
VRFSQESHDDFKPKYKQINDNEVQAKMEQYMKEIDEEVHKNPIFLYMKGTPERPECGFSRATSMILEQYGYEYETDNMNANLLKKEALKKYSDWPTIPQLFVKGELIGGCDIVTGLHRDGELEAILKESGAKKKAK